MISKQGMDDIEVKEVVFLTPAKITMMVNGLEKTVMVSVDIINRKAYTEDGSDYLSDLVFSHLERINSLPEDFFGASEEVMEEAENAEEDRLRIYQEAIGANNERDILN
jgi:hypothetical protein